MRMNLLGLGLGVVALLAGCTATDEPSGQTADTSDAGTTSADAGAQIVDAGTPGVDAGTPIVDAGQPPDAGNIPQESWYANAVEHRAQIGQRFTYPCSSNGVADSIWGTDIYTDDSSVCTAAVHVGLITLQSGGMVTIEMAPGQESYAASTRNGITSLSYPAWQGSFFFP